MFSEWYYGDQIGTIAILAELAICGALVIIVAGHLTRLADTISEVLNLSKAWIGLLLLAGITSLPEVITGGTAVFIGQPDLAFGNIFGSCMLNVAIIVILDVAMRHGSVLTRAGLPQAHSLSSSMGMVLMGLAVLALALVDRTANNPQSFPVSAAAVEAVMCVVIAGAYVACMQLNYRFERQQQVEGQLELPSPIGVSRGWLYGKCSLAAAMLVALSIWLTRTGDVLQDHPIELLGGRMLGATFVGAFFLAAATSLPEIATSIAAVRIGHLDLALGNIFGSNMFNIFVIPMLKVCTLITGDELLMHGPGFSTGSHTITALFAMLVTGVAAAGLIYRTKRRVFHFGFDSIIIGLIYLVGMYVLLT